MTTSEIQAPGAHPKNINTSRGKKQAEATRLRKKFALASRVQVQADGSRRFVRFSQTEILEHWVLLISFLALGATGLLQLMAGWGLVARFINSVIGGLSSVQTIHQVSAIVFIALSLFHAGRILYIWIVKRESGSMKPRFQDGSDLRDTIRYNLGKMKARPFFGRFTIEEKLGYWALLLFAIIMILTGLIQWFPTVATWLFPGWVIPISRTMHQSTALLAIVAVLTWHLYYTVFRERNGSIFTGLMSQQAMQENHILEYEEIVAAYEEVQNLS
jgi:cytochrome b subunit of formate dehydrogenase